jgi:hypothetical protein
VNVICPFFRTSGPDSGRGLSFLTTVPSPHLQNVNRTGKQFVIRYHMNEINLVFLGLIALVASVILLWVLEVPEIIEDKEIEIITALGIGLLILILDKRSDRNLHEKIHQQHEIIAKMHKMINEQHELIRNISVQQAKNDSTEN